MKLHALALLAVLALAAGCKVNEHDNARPPAPSSSDPVQNHRFDGGETDPYGKPGEAAPGGEAAAPKE